MNGCTYFVEVCQAGKESVPGRKPNRWIPFQFLMGSNCSALKTHRIYNRPYYIKSKKV